MATGFLKFDHDHTVYIDLDLATDEVRKAVIIDADDVETPICGGGGDSDFTTAKLTVTNTGLATTVFCANIDTGMTNPFIYIGENETETFDIALYKGKAVIDVNARITQIISYSGDIHLEGDPEYLVATGDCAITVNDNVA